MNILRLGIVVRKRGSKFDDPVARKGGRTKAEVSAPPGKDSVMARFWKLTVTALAACGVLTAVSSPARAQSAQMVCGERVEIVNALQTGHQEQKTAAGLSGNGGLVELFTGDAGTWTLLLTLPGGPTCLLGAGEAWEGWEHTGQPNEPAPQNTSMPMMSGDWT